MTSTRGRHTPEALAGFLSDEGRQAWARCLDGTMFYLPERGGTIEVRQRAEDAGLLCPVETCRAPEYRLAAGPVRRHSFRHRRGTQGATGHSRESADHISAKQLIRAWAQGHGAVARTEAGVDTRRRVADVLASLPPTIGQGDVAFEIQYAQAPLTGADGLPARSQDYASLGIPDVWLFGHTGHQMNKARRPAGDDEPQDEVLLNPEQQHVASQGRRVRWINPSEEMIATAVVYAPDPPADAPVGWWDRPGDHGPRRPRGDDRTAVLHLDPLADCELAADGMVTPTDRWLDGERRRVEDLAAVAKAQHDAQADERRRDTTRAPRPFVPPVVSRPSPQRPEAKRQEPPPRPHPPALRPSGPRTLLWDGHAPTAWDRHPLKDSLERLCGGQVPGIVEDRLPTDDGIQADHQVWHATAYARLVHGNAGRRFNRGQVVEASFQDRYPHRDAWELHRAGMAYLDALATAGLLVELRAGYYGVVSDLTGASASPDGPWETVVARDGLAALL